MMPKGLTIIIEPNGTRYHAYCPELKGLHTYGNILAETQSNAEDAIAAYLESLEKHGETLPPAVKLTEE